MNKLTTSFYSKVENFEEWKTCPICHFQHGPEHPHWEEANGETPLDQPVIPVAVDKPTTVGVDSLERQTPTRDREKYNAYMRRYMKEKRKKEKA